MNLLDELIAQLKSDSGVTEFHDVIHVINKHYLYTPTCFTNGPKEVGITNASGENEGSCKIFSFAEINHLNIEQTLNCFGKYYRDDVLNHPEGSDHQNIRTFIKYGWEHLTFEGRALKELKE